MKVFLEVVVQTFLAFFSILYLARILGRQQVSQLTFHEYVNGITFGSIAATLATDTDQRTWQYFTGLILFGALTFLISYITMKSRTVSKVLDGEPILVIQNGKILEKNLKRARYNMDQINALLREENCLSPNDVQYGILEIDGKLSVVKRGDKRNVTVGDLDIPPSVETIPTELVLGGQIIYENLRKKNIDGRTLLSELKKQGVNRIAEVMYASMDQNNKLYVDKFDDELTRKIDISEDNRRV